MFTCGKIEAQLCRNREEPGGEVARIRVGTVILESRGSKDRKDGNETQDVVRLGCVQSSVWQTMRTLWSMSEANRDGRAW